MKNEETRDIIRKTILILLIILTMFLFSNCTAKNEIVSIQTPSKEHIDMAEISLEKNYAANSLKEEPVNITFETQFIRVEEVENSPQHQVVTTAQQLTQYAAAYKTSIDNTLMQKYDDDFFNEKALVLVLITENSGSISHEIDVNCHDNILKIDIARQIPDGFITMDMATWLAIIELEKAYVDNTILVEIL